MALTVWRRDNWAQLLLLADATEMTKGVEVGSGLGSGCALYACPAMQLSSPSRPVYHYQKYPAIYTSGDCSIDFMTRISINPKSNNRNGHAGKQVNKLKLFRFIP